VDRFTLGTLEIFADVQKSTDDVSVHTGNGIPNITITFSVHPTAVEEVKKAIVAQRFQSVDLAGKQIEWATGSWRESYSGDPLRSEHKFTIDLKLREKLDDLKALVIEDLSCKPYEYEESSKKDGLEVVARVRLTAAEHDRFRELQSTKKTVMVVRRGISDVPRMMSFGRVLWSRSEEEFKLNIVLFDETRVQYSTLSDPAVVYPRRVAFEAKSKLNKLIEILRSKAILTEAEMRTLDSAGPTDEDRLSLDRVDDLDDFLSH
jgi:hypothetical protein